MAKKKPTGLWKEMLAMSNSGEKVSKKNIKIKRMQKNKRGK